MKSILFGLLFLTTSTSFAQIVSTVAGTAGVIGNSNGIGTAASFNNPHGITTDRLGNIYVANRFGHTIRKITPSGVVSTFAGSGNVGATDATGTAASFNEPWAVACDSVGNVYVADTKNYKIRKITPAGVVTTIAGTGVFGVTNGAANLAQFGFPSGLAVNDDASVIYVCDRMTNTIRKIQNGVVTTVAGVVYSPGSNDGPAASAKFDHPYSVALDVFGNLIIADEFNNKIRKLSTAGIVSTIAGNGTMGSANGPALSASFNSPWSVCVDENGDILVGDANNFTIRKISQGVVSLYAGQNGIAGMVNGPLLQSSFNGVSAITYNAANFTYYLCDPYSQLVRKMAQQTLLLTTSTGATTFCTGSNITLVASPSNLGTYVFKEGATILGTSANGTLTINSLNIGLHNITCTATNSSGQPIPSNVMAIDITPGLQVTINAQGSTTICQGDSVTLTPSLTGTYLWSTGATSQSIKASVAGAYTVTVTNAQGCSGQSTPVQIQLLQPPAATVSIGTSQPVCIGDSTTLAAGTAINYLWSNGDTTQTTYITSPGNYTVIVSNGVGCSAISLPISVPFYTQTTATTTPAGTALFPQGSSVNITANTGNGYLWSNGFTSQTINVITPGTYTVTVTDQNGCESLPATVQASYISSSNMITVTGQTEICEGDTVLLISAFTTNNQWYRNGTIISGASQQNYYVSQAGQYQVRYTNSPSPAIFSDSVEIIVRTVPNSVIATSDSICENGTANLSVAPQSGVIYNWFESETGGSTLGTGLSYITTPLSQTQSYYVELTNSYGCVRENRFEIIATVIQEPNSTFLSSEPTTAIDGYEVIFLSNYVGGSAYLWDFGDPSSSTNTSSDPNPHHTYGEPGDYNVTLTVTNTFGCVSITNHILKIYLDNNIFIPTGFTPNGDGNNDIFRVRGNNIIYSDMNIYNQYGEKIWGSQKETIGWNGQAKGDLVPVGNYAYAIEVFFDNGTKTFYRGNISVIK